MHLRLSSSTYSLFVSLVAIVPVPATILSQHCLHEARVLSFNFACSAHGAGDFMTPIGRHIQTIYIDHYSENDGSPHPSVWSYKPVCTEILEGIGSKLCVYTNASFSGGRGISIFSTPEIAEEFAALPAFQDLTALDEINSSDSPWYTQSLQGKGIGTLAKRDLERGDLVMAYTAVLLVYRENSLPIWKREKFLRIAVNQLPFSTRQSYLSLATNFGNPGVIVQDIINTNAYDIKIGGQMHGAIFPEISRINHDCAPNSQYYVDPYLLTHFVHASRPISQDQEITVSYLNLLHPFVTRQQYLLDTFHFTCSCSRCMSPDASDAVLAQIASLQETLADWSPGSTATIENAEKLIQLYKQEGLDSLLNLAYGYATLTYSGFGDGRRARMYAELTAEAVALKDGPRAADLKMWTRLIDNPKEHWSWKRKSRP